MYRGKRRASAALLVIAAAVAVIGGAAGCSSSSSDAQSAPPPAQMERVGNSPVPSVVLTQAGARRIGVQTAPVATVKAGPMTSIPYSALLYEPDGSTAVYVNTAPLVYTRYFIQVATIVGNQVYVSKGLTRGMSVVTVGAEELLGVQNGVGVET